MPDAGRHEGWQWALIEDDIALDNMPLIQQYRDDLDMRIKYQAVVVPREVLTTIAAILELS